jgi:hypothetical protein
VTYAAEPYAQFVDDLLTSLTGGEVREQFRFLPEQAPFRLASPAAVLPDTVRVHGLVDSQYTRFRAGTDYQKLGADKTLVWLAAGSGVALPDAGSVFFVNYEHQGSNPQLTDRNPGSVTRLLAESFAREYAVLSRQLEAVYQSAFLDTGGGRDLEQLAALVGVARRRRLSATGSALLRRNSPAPADIFIPAGTRLSTDQPPAVAFETSEDRTLQRGNLSVEAPVAARVSGALGVVAADAIRVIDRPILGIDSVSNPQATRFAGADETDEQLRERCRRALETSGAATTGALLGALTTLPGLREKDIRIAEDYLAHPGVVKLSIALPEMSAAELDSAKRQAIELIEATRPLGVRVEHNIDASRPLGPATPGGGAVAVNPALGDPANVGIADPAKLLLPVNIDLVLTPITLSLSADERNKLMQRADGVVANFVKDAGIGETLVYNRLVAGLMALDGVLDVSLALYPEGKTALDGRKNLIADNPNARPVRGQVDIKIGGSLILIDVAVNVVLQGAALAAPDASAPRGAALADIAEKLKNFVATLGTQTLTVALLKGQLTGSDTYTVSDLHYKVEYMEAGVRVHQQDVELPLSGLERLWLHGASLLNPVAV